MSLTQKNVVILTVAMLVNETIGLKHIYIHIDSIWSHADMSDVVIKCIKADKHFLLLNTIHVFRITASISVFSWHCKKEITTTLCPQTV